MTVWWLLIAVGVVSWGLTLLLRRYALAKSLMDISNERSSHSVPTPRGGGVAIVASFLLALPVLSVLNMLSPAAFCGLLGSGLLVAVIGFADDHGHIAAKWRLLGHFIAAAWALYWLNGFLLALIEN
ncbi:UDP-N-acetylmuramyl pentapeptide phosphotransferase/UDP-N-acetylglucosamine-1-phosphate transferase [Pseudomonas corrugata]|nr:UDP-N-acetylmuramyl pentapeptide phosphotransferase/UDP-N-acetylglucosamine-1-phosphate transferase [Pseudomonas corrugata]